MNVNTIFIHFLLVTAHTIVFLALTTIFFVLSCTSEYFIITTSYKPQNMSGVYPRIFVASFITFPIVVCSYKFFSKLIGL